MRALRQHPGERQLRGSAAFLIRQRLHLPDQREVAGEVLALEARVGAPVVIGGKVGGTLDRAGQKAAAQGTVGNEADAEPLAGLQHPFFVGIARPQRELALQRRDAMHAVGALEGERRDLREPEVTDLPGTDQLRHGADGLLDRHGAVDPMQVVEVDVGDLEALQAGLARLPDPLGAGVDDARRGVLRVAHEAELCGEEHRVAPAGERTPHELLVGVGTIYVRGVEEIQAELECTMDGCDRFGVVVRAVELAHAHAPEPQARNRGAVAAERARLHGDLLADRMQIFCAALHCSTNTQEEGGAGGPGDSSAAPASGARGARHRHRGRGPCSAFLRASRRSSCARDASCRAGSRAARASRRAPTTPGSSTRSRPPGSAREGAPRAESAPRAARCSG